MPTELNTPNHRYYQRRYNIALPKEDMSRDFIFASGIAKIDAWIDLLAGRDYSVLGFEPLFVADFDGENYRVQGATTPSFSDAITHTRASTATYVDSTGTLQTAAINEPRVGHHVWNGTAWVTEGLLHESAARTNHVRNSTGQGATVGVVGSGGALPTNWSIFNFSGAGAEVVGFGTDSGRDYIDLKFDGTPTSGIILNFEGNTSIAAIENEVWTVSFGVEGIAGDDTNIVKYRAGFAQYDSGGNFLSPSFYGDISLDDISQRAHFSYTASNASTAFVRPRLLIEWTSGAINRTLRISLPQAEKAPTPSSVIPTSGSTVTRAADVLTIPAANLPWPEPVVIGPEIAVGAPDLLEADWTDNGDDTYTCSGALTSGETEIRWIDASITAGKVFRVSGTISGRTQGALGVKLGGGATNNFTNNGAFEVVLADGSATNVQFIEIGVGGLGFDGTISNLSVREINPLALSIQMDGRVTYADEGIVNNARFVRWFQDASNFIINRIDTDSGTGEFTFSQLNAGVADTSNSGVNLLSPDILVPYNIASRHGSTFINGAVDGTALTANTTPTALPDLSATNLNLGHSYNGTIRTFRIWSKDIGDAGLVEATEPSLVPSLSLTFDGTENSFVVLDWSE